MQIVLHHAIADGVGSITTRALGYLQLPKKITARQITSANSIFDGLQDKHLRILLFVLAANALGKGN